MVYVFFASGFEETEAIATVDVLRRGGINVTTVGISGSVVTGSHGIAVTTDITDSNIVLDDTLEAVVLPGGMPGTLNLELNASVNEAITYADEHGKYIAAICAAPMILGKKGLLDGREATVYPSPELEKHLENAKYSKKSVARDGKFITANGPGASLKFGVEIVAALKSREVADEIAAAMQM